MALEEELAAQLAPQLENLMSVGRRDVVRSIASAPAAVAAAQRGGPLAALRTAQAFHPQPPTPPTELDIVAAKRRVLADMQDYLKSKDDSKIGILDKIGKMQRANDGMLDIFKQYVSGNQSASQAVATAQIRLRGDLAGLYATAARERMANKLTGGSVRSAYEGTRQMLFGGPDQRGQIFGPEAVAAVGHEVLNNMTLGDGDRAEIWAALSAEAAAQGKSLTALLEMAAADDTNAQRALAQLHGIQSQVTAIENDTLDKVAQQNTATLEGALGQGAGMSMGTLVNAWKQYQSIYDPAAGAESMQNTLELVFDEMAPKGTAPDLMGNYQALLEGIDKPTAELSGVWVEAKNRLINDPAFKQMMELKGFRTPEAALKWMKQELRKKNREDRMADAVRARDIRAGIPSEAEAAAAAAPEGVVPGAVPGEPAEPVLLADPLTGEAEQPDVSMAPKFAAKKVPRDPAEIQPGEADFNIEIMMWDPTTKQWYADHPLLQQQVALLEGLPGGVGSVVGDQLLADLDPLMEESRAQGYLREYQDVAGAEATLVPEEEPEERERKPFLLPSPKMVQLAAKDILFGGGARRLEEGVGAINRALVKGRERRAARAEEQAAPFTGTVAEAMGGQFGQGFNPADPSTFGQVQPTRLASGALLEEIRGRKRQ